ncbi:permease [Desulfurobacterium sp.]
MNITTIVVNGIALACLILAFKKDAGKAKKAVKIAFKASVRMLPMVITVILLIGIMLGFVPKSTITRFAGEKAGIKGVIVTAVLGAILHIPSIISFPLAASLLKNGASVTSVAVFITTLTMIGMVTLPLEIRELGKKLALLRNGLSFIAAIIIGLLMGMIL